MEFSDLKRKGVIVLYNSQPHEVVWSLFMRKQQRKPVIQTKLRNLITGKVVEYSFKAGEKVEEAEVTRRANQYLYADQNGVNFMDLESYETITLTKEVCEDKIPFLKEGDTVYMKYFDGKPISVEPPVKVELKVTETMPGVKGDTATGGTKPATLETGLVVNVPLFVKEGDIVRVNTDTGEYVERVS